MKIKIKSCNDLIASDEIDALINLLPEKYRIPKLTLKILVFDNPLQQRIHEAVKLMWSSKLSGAVFFYNKKKYVIHIHPYRFEQVVDHCTECLKLKIVEALYHELRHVFQKDYMSKWYDEQDATYEQLSKKNCQTYSYQPLERDADRFSRVYMNRLHDEINAILSISSSWRITNRT